MTIRYYRQSKNHQYLRILNSSKSRQIKKLALLLSPKTHHSSLRCCSYLPISGCTSLFPVLTTRGRTLIMTMCHLMRWISWSQLSMQLTSAGKLMSVNFRNIMRSMDHIVIKRLNLHKQSQKSSGREMISRRVTSKLLAFKRNTLLQTKFQILKFQRLLTGEPSEAMTTPDK